MRARAILIAAAVLVVALGGGAVWVAANDKDHPSAELFSSSDDPTRAPAPAAPPETEPAPPTAPDQSAPEQDGAPTITEDGGEPTTMEPAPAPSPSTATSGPKRKTHFKREPKRARQNDEPERQFSVPPAREFTGDGNARLGTVDVKATSVLKWRTKGRFEVHFGREDFPIIAPTSTGQLVLPPFRFEQVRVIARGPWRITISPQ